MAEPTSLSATDMKWSDRFLLGFTPMDNLHEEFIHIIGACRDAYDEDLPRLLVDLQRHLQEHFEAENRWMVESDFPPRDCHIGEHAAVLQSVEEVRRQLSHGDTSICRLLVEELAAWFPSHADHLDSALAHWLSKLRFGGKPVVVRRDLKLR